MATAFIRASIDGMAAAVLVWVICRALPRLGASTRTWLWWLVALKFLLGLNNPVVLEVLPLAPNSPATSRHVAFQPAVHFLSGAVTRLGDLITLRPAVGPELQKSMAAHVAANSRAPVPPPSWATFLGWLASVWAIGVTISVGLGVGGWRRARRILRRSRPAPPQVQQIVADLAAQLGLRRAPTVKDCDEVTTPLIVVAPRTTVVLAEAPLPMSAASQRL